MNIKTDALCYLCTSDSYCMNVDPLNFSTEVEERNCFPLPKLKAKIARLHLKFRKLSPFNTLGSYCIPCYIQPPVSPDLNCNVHLGHCDHNTPTARKNGKFLKKLIPVLVIMLKSNIFTLLLTKTPSQV